MLSIKKKGNRYYREDRFSFRSFPIKAIEAEKLITEGKAELVDFFLWELKEYNESQEQKQVQQEVKPSNVFSITDRIQAKQEEQKTQEAINKFMAEYLPNLTKQDMETILNSGENFGQEIVKICWRIDLEKKLREQK
jgi:predicted transcriptional regulator